jgi:hypothetical protein
MKHMQQTLLNTMAQQGPTEATFAGMMGGAMNSNPRQPSSGGNGQRQMSGPDGLDNFFDDINNSSKRNVDL